MFKDDGFKKWKSHHKKNWMFLPNQIPKQLKIDPFIETFMPKKFQR